MVAKNNKNVAIIFFIILAQIYRDLEIFTPQKKADKVKILLNFISYMLRY